MTHGGLTVRDLGRMGYTDTLALQREVNQSVIAGELPGALLLVEHEPVITLTHRKGIASHLLASSERLGQLGIAVAETDRGGDITYHGPGQLVAYPIIRLADYGLNLSKYMRLLEQVVIDTVAAFGVRAGRVEGCTGVWVEVGDQGPGISEQGESHATPACDRNPDPRSLVPDPRRAKLCALGVRVRRNVTMHGLALNVTTDLSHFDTIVPCGLANRAVTSLAQLLGECVPTMDAVKRELVRRMTASLDVTNQSTLTK